MPRAFAFPAYPRLFSFQFSSPRSSRFRDPWLASSPVFQTLDVYPARIRGRSLKWNWISPNAACLSNSNLTFPFANQRASRIYSTLDFLPTRYAYQTTLHLVGWCVVATATNRKCETARSYEAPGKFIDRQGVTTPVPALALPSEIFPLFMDRLQRPSAPWIALPTCTKTRISFSTVDCVAIETVSLNFTTCECYRYPWVEFWEIKEKRRNRYLKIYLTYCWKNFM